jgi:hypothetical protein
MEQRSSGVFQGVITTYYQERKPSRTKQEQNGSSHNHAASTSKMHAVVETDSWLLILGRPL